jgi:hypothetical protein
MIMMGSSARVSDGTDDLMPLPLPLGALPFDVVMWRACLRSRRARRRCRHVEPTFAGN